MRWMEFSKTGRSLQNFLSKYFRKFEPAREVSTCHVLYWSYSPIVFDRVQVQLSLTLLLRLEDFFHSYPNLFPLKFVMQGSLIEESRSWAREMTAAGLCCEGCLGSRRWSERNILIISLRLLNVRHIWNRQAADSSSRLASKSYTPINQLPRYFPNLLSKYTLPLDPLSHPRLFAFIFLLATYPSLEILLEMWPGQS